MSRIVAIFVSLTDMLWIDANSRINDGCISMRIEEMMNAHHGLQQSGSIDWYKGTCTQTVKRTHTRFLGCKTGYCGCGHYVVRFVANATSARLATSRFQVAHFYGLRLCQAGDPLPKCGIMLLSKLCFLTNPYRDDCRAGEHEGVQMNNLFKREESCSYEIYASVFL
jgi:hypothetical protein